MNDFRFALRSLLKTPGFTAVAVLTLALGLGANSAAFTLVNAFYLKPLPYAEPDQLLSLWETEPDSREVMTVAPANYADWRAQSRTLASIAAFNVAFPTVSSPAGAERPLAGVASADFFEVLGVRPMLGREFAPEDELPGAEHVALVSHGFWQRAFAGDPDILSRTLRVNGVPHTVIGVMPLGYRHPERADVARVELWTPLGLADQAGSRQFRFLRVIGRMRPGTTLAEVKAEFDGIGRRLAEAYPEHNRGRSVVVRALDDELFGDRRSAVLILAAAAVLVLLIVCANVANLMLARGQARVREFAIRAALGSTRLQLLRQLVIEAVIVALAGAAAGIAIVDVAGAGIKAVQERYLTPTADPSLDWRVAMFTIALSLLTALVFSALPAFRASRADLRSVLTEGGPGSGLGAPTRRARSGLVVAEVALATVLLVSAGLLMRSFVNLVRVPPGFERRDVLSFEVGVPPYRYAAADDVQNLYDRLSATLASLPGVSLVSSVSDLPFTGWNMFLEFRVGGAPRVEPWRTEFQSVGADYFRVMGVPLLAGRAIEPGDRAEAPPVAVVNRALADEIWPARSALGQEVTVGDGAAARSFTVVGVVADILDDGFDSQAEPRLYFSFSQRPRRTRTMLLRTVVPPLDLLPAVRRTVGALDPDIPVGAPRSLEQVVAETVAVRRLALLLAAGFAAVAVLLAAVGVFGVLSYTVSERTREIGLRTALGAARLDVHRLVLGQSLRIAALGVGLGLGAALLVNRVIARLLFGVTPSDPLTFVAVGAVLLTVALVAAYLPARRAMRIDPMEALRHE